MCFKMKLQCNYNQVVSEVAPGSLFTPTYIMQQQCETMSMVRWYPGCFVIVFVGRHSSNDQAVHGKESCKLFSICTLMFHVCPQVAHSLCWYLQSSFVAAMIFIIFVLTISLAVIILAFTASKLLKALCTTQDSINKATLAVCRALSLSWDVYDHLYCYNWLGWTVAFLASKAWKLFLLLLLWSTEHLSI